MKTFEENIKIIIELIALLVLISSCSSNSDIYRNPYQVAYNEASIAGSVSYTTPLVSHAQPPEWIYAVSNEFVVGYGSGKDLIEAKNGAINDIKSFIIRSLGETGNIVQVNLVENMVTGRNNVESREVYIMRNQFENKYKPVINITTDRFVDYYYKKTGDAAKYFIKYKINDAELTRIKNDYLRSVHENLFLAAKTRHIIDSLIDFHDDASVESLVERYEGISKYMLSPNLRRNDSLLLAKGMQNITSILNRIEIRILEHIPGDWILFGLFCGQNQVRSECLPFINYSDIEIDSLIKTNDTWELNYKTKISQNSHGVIEIIFDLPYKRLATRLAVPLPISKPMFEINDKIVLSELRKDNWNKQVKSFKISINIHSNTDRIYMINSLELIPHASGNDFHRVVTDNFIQVVKPGSNQMIRTILCDIPAKVFQSREMVCDVSFFYSAGKDLKTCNLKNIPLCINNL